MLLDVLKTNVILISIKDIFMTILLRLKMNDFFLIFPKIELGNKCI